MPFRDLAGNRSLLALVSRAIARGTLPPSLLLAGPEGIGKCRVAVAVAQALNCLQPRVAAGGADAAGTFAHDACGTCPACRRIERRVHPDVLVIEPGEMGSIKIDQVRDAIERAAYRPFEGRRRVVVIDHAETLRTEAQHALLKTLEEPPAASVFLLVASRPDALLATVRSRCQRLRFAPLPAAEVAEVLVRDHRYSEADARAAAADAGGSVGRALDLQAADLAEARAAACRLLAQAARGDAARRLAAVRDLGAKKSTPAEERARLAACLRAVSSLLRDLELLALDGDRSGLTNTDLVAELTRLAPAFDSARNLRAFLAVDRALTVLGPPLYANSKVVAGWVAVELGAEARS